MFDLYVEKSFYPIPMIAAWIISSQFYSFCATVIKLQTLPFTLIQLFDDINNLVRYL